MTDQDRINAESAAQLAAAEAAPRPIAEMAVAAQVLALSLFSFKAMACMEKDRCLVKEGRRLVGWPQLPSGAVNRAWENFDPAKLCRNCRAYFHAEMCAAEMRTVARFEAEDEALETMR